ncbi:NAD-dependent epimerase/dehydratase family protein, partial [Thermoproteota archaeon]
MSAMEKELRCLAGYSDHTLGIDIPVMAASLGAVVIEKHFTLDKEMNGPDHKASVDPLELKEMIRQIREKKEIEIPDEIMGDGIKRPTPDEIDIMKVAKVLVTGGAGFIGSHIVDILIENDYDVVIVDNLSTGNKANINPKARLYEVDITNILLRDVFKKEKPDFVIHEAAQINVRKSVTEPVFDAITNIVGTIELLECCKDFKVKKIVYAGSGGACYGEPEQLPCDEKHAVNPVSHYGVSKHAAEHYFFLYNYLYKIDYVILRYSNVYGPRQDPKGEAGVISIFLARINEDKKPQIFGDGEQTRDYVFVGDVARANLLALEKETKSTIFNIGTGKETSVNELYALIKKATETEIIAEHTDPIPGEVQKISLDCSLVEKDLGWIPKVDIESGINQTVEWFNRK